MADETPPSAPAAPVPRGPRGAQRPQPSAPSNTAGFPITTGRRLPPGIPTDLAGAVVTEAQPQAAPKHPMFAPVPATVNHVRNAAAALRGQLIAAATQGERTLASIENVLKLAADDTSKDLLKAEGIDLDHLVKFKEAITAALALTK